MRPLSWFESLNCAIEGILWAARTQRNLRYHFLAAIAILIVAILFKVSAPELIFLAFAIIIVFFAELINTALEVLVDLVSPDYHPLARRAKDVAAGAVVVACVGAVVIGYLALSRHLLVSLNGSVGELSRPPGEFAFFSVLVVIFLVILAKGFFRRGLPLRGGMPSGHAAVSFSIATSVILLHGGIILSSLCLLMAFLISQSRMLIKVHSFWEVAAGAALGSATTLLLFHLYP
ncbi:MAG: diacylglycerol kinase [Deltaproteobacteria bacterium]|nr:diacylglycerol kinase [Deltaproteobacteria bacterium]